MKKLASVALSLAVLAVPITAYPGTYDTLDGMEVDTETLAGDPAYGKFFGADSEEQTGIYMYHVIRWLDEQEIETTGATTWRVIQDGRVSIGGRLFSPPDPETGRMWETVQNGQMLEAWK